MWRHRRFGRSLAGWSAVAAVALLIGTLAWWTAVLVGPTLRTGAVQAIVVIREWGRWGILASIGLMVLHSFAPFPSELLACANGLIFGPVLGGLVTWIGAMLGAAAAFAVARRLGRPLVLRLLPERQARQLAIWADRQGGEALLLGRLVPIVAFNLINYAAGLAGIDWWTYLWTTAVGIAPMTVLTALLGDRMLNLPTWIWALLAAVVAIGAIASKKVRSGGVT